MKVIKKIGKVLLYVFGVVLLLLLVVSIAIDPIAKSLIERQVNEFNENQYTLNLNDVNISLLSGNIILKGITLQTDTSKAIGKEVPVIYLDAGEISAEGISWLKFLLTDELYIDRISLLDIRTEMKVRTLEDDEESKPFQWNQLDIYPDLKEHIDRIRLKDLRFNQIDLTMINIESADTLLFSSGEFNLNSDDILVDADKVFTDTRAFYASQIDLEGKEIEIKRSGTVEWKLDFDLVYIDTREEDLSLLSENMLFINTGDAVNDTLIFAGYSRFEINDIELNALRTDSIANIRNIILHNLNILTYLDVEEELEPVDPNQPNSSSIDLSTFSLGESLPEFVRQINIEEIDLQDLRYNQNDEIVVKSFHLNSHNFRLDNAPAFSDNRFLHFDHFMSSVHGIEINDNTYNIVLNDFNADIENGKGSIRLDSLSVNPLQNLTSETLIHVDLQELLVNLIDVTELSSKILKIDSIAILNPIIKASMSATPVNEAEETGVTEDLYPFISDYLINLSIRKVAFINGDIEVEGFGEQRQDIRLPVVYVQVSDIDIAEDNAFSGRRIFHADDIAVRMENINYSLPDNVYNATLALVRMSTREKFLSVDNFGYSFNNNYKQILEAPESNQVFTVKGNQFLISNLEFHDFIKNNGFFASRILLEGLEAYVYKDNNYPEEESDSKVYPNPQAMIMDVDMPFYVGEFNLKNGSLTFEEMAEGGEEAGIFTTDNINVSLKNLSNNQNILKNDPETSLDISTKIMGAGLLEIQIKIPMLDTKQPVVVSGSLDTLNLTRLNAYTEYTTRFGIASGTFYEILWDFDTSNDISSGEFGMSYENLNIQLSEAESPDTDGFLNTIISYLANALVLDEDLAEGKHEKPETSAFEREKDEDEGFIEHYINSLMAGFVEVMGFPLSIIDP